MSAGTLTLTNNSAAVTGSGTAFTTELAAGDFIVVTVGGIPYTLAIKTVNSNTSLTLVSSYTGPTQAGAAWYAVPRVAMNLVTAALVAQSAEALRGLNYDKQNWQSIFSGTGNVTVTLPDGSSFTGPAWNSFTQALNGKADKVNGAVPVNQGGTGATTAESARSNLGLGTSATKDTGTSNGNVIQVGGFGIGADSSLASQLASLTDGYRAGLYRMRGDGAPPSTIGAPVGSGNSIIGLVSVPVYSTAGFGLAFNRDNLWTGVFDPANPSGATWKKWWGESNTTVDTNGFIKRASPVVKLFGTGEIECNDEAEGVAASREAAGVYRVTGSCGLNSEGWTVEIPQDINGNFLCFVDIKSADDGELTVSVFRRRFDVETAMIIAGDPMDIPEGRWIDLRLDMPEDSIWNRRQKEVIDVALQEPTS
ncbi:phage tail protein [Enterobacter cloacae]|uniref:phage tail fiber protein n=1 Tax=Enterobacter cloacae TaxID=550 RepID=UPI0031747BE3